jgi:hypothetical protein
MRNALSHGLAGSLASDTASCRRVAPAQGITSAIRENDRSAGLIDSFSPGAHSRGRKVYLPMIGPPRQKSLPSKGPGSRRSSFDPTRRNPQPPRGPDRIDRLSDPPCGFIAESVKISVVGPAERDCELVADFASHRAGLREFQMMGVSGTSPANQTRLR